MNVWNREDLAQFDGRDGKPIYIVHQGKVFDVSESKMWKGGLHMKRHHAGSDLTTDIQAAPHGPEVLERYPQVGVVKEKEPAGEPGKAAQSILIRLLEQYPMLRRHPHPMTVHFPLVFMLSTTFFTLLYLITGTVSFEATALHCLTAGMLFMPVVILTGLLSWWLNYLAKPLRPVNIKLGASLVLFVVALILFTWRMAVPDILTAFRPESVLYLLLVLSLASLVTVIGWQGAKLTFPIEKE